MTRSTNMEHVEVLERLRGVLEHGKMGDKCLIAPDLVTAAIASLSAPQPPARTASIPKSSPNGWLQAGGLLYRLTEGHRPQNRDEINVTMVHGSRDPAHCEARAAEILAMLQSQQQPPAEALGRGEKASRMLQAEGWAWEGTEWTRPPAEAQERPAKPAECADGCPDQQVCDHCQWPPGPDAEAQPDARGVVDEGSRAAQQQGGGDLDEVVCLACGDHIMPMGQVCHACSHPVSEPPSAPVGVEERAKAIAAEFCPRGDYDHGDVIEAIEYALAQQPAACAGCEGKPAPENSPCNVCGQQPAAVDGVWLRPVIKQGDYVAKWGFCNPEEPDAVCFFPSPQQGGES